MMDWKNSPDSESIEYDKRREAAWAELALVADTIDDEIETLKEATTATHELLQLEFTV